MFGHREVVATCTWEGADLQTAPTREQTETMSRGARATSLRAGAPECTNHTETELRSAQGWLAPGSVRNTKDRDTQALEVRAGMPGVGRTSQDTCRAEQHEQ